MKPSLDSFESISSCIKLNTKSYQSSIHNNNVKISFSIAHQSIRSKNWWFPIYLISIHQPLRPAAEVMWGVCQQTINGWISASACKLSYFIASIAFGQQRELAILFYTLPIYMIMFDRRLGPAADIGQSQHQIIANIQANICREAFSSSLWKNSKEYFCKD